MEFEETNEFKIDSGIESGWAVSRMVAVLIARCEGDVEIQSDEASG